ncbi:unnamed protein product [Lymnaea stagnalis]|uniref:Sodium/potassium-transporting ATPase subunit beta-1-interacting protein n=1 Tax=Lymnaea stagnalis TaxID=6523 RepID=A0AAV2IA00_LYMST
MKLFLLTPVSAKNCRYKDLYGSSLIQMWNMQSNEKIFAKALRTTLIVLFILQLVSDIERQIFDFLGYMWAPIIGNFFQIIVVILGIFGACNFYRSFIVVYATWNLLWLGWNIFVICLYLEVGILNRNRERYILTIGTEGKSWWLEHGIGCEVTNSSWDDGEMDSGRRVPPEAYVVGCILQYYYVEVIHAAVQCILSLGGFVASLVCIYSFIEENDAMSSANDELEFVKMRYRTPTHMAAYRDDRDDMAFDNINLTTDTLPHSNPVPRQRGEREMPPSYDTTMRNAHATAAANHYYASERQSVRSKASTRSKRSTHRQTSANSNSVTYSEPVRDLPWVQITPMSDSHMIRNYP